MGVAEWGSRCRRRSTCCEPREERAHGVAAVADRVLLLVAELGHRQPLRPVVGKEHGVIAETPITSRRGRESPRAAAFEDTLGALDGVDVCDHAHVLERTADGRLRCELLEVLL